LKHVYYIYIIDWIYLSPYETANTKKHTPHPLFKSQRFTTEHEPSELS